jgi:hypothetical protein
MDVCRSLATLAAACLVSIFAMMGCSSNGTSSAPTASSGQTEGSGASSGETGTSGENSGSGTSGESSGGAETSDATTDARAGQIAPDASGGCPEYPGVTVANVDAGAETPTWSCVEANCGMQLATCAADCQCNDLILKAFFASHDLASANAAFKAALANGSPPGDAILVGVCLQLNQSGCPMWGSGGADAASGD